MLYSACQAATVEESCGSRWSGKELEMNFKLPPCEHEGAPPQEVSPRAANAIPMTAAVAARGAFWLSIIGTLSGTPTRIRA